MTVIARKLLRLLACAGLGAVACVNISCSSQVCRSDLRPDCKLQKQASATARRFAELVVTKGVDHYGTSSSGLVMSIIDARTDESPAQPELFDALVRTEGRLHRRAPRGSNLWNDQALIRGLWTAASIYQDSRFSKAADQYVADYFRLAKRPNGTLSWGSHLFYNAYSDRCDDLDQQGQGPHEILVNRPEWREMYRICPHGVRDEISAMWTWHVVNKQTGQFNRHDDRRVECDFAFFGGELVLAFAEYYSVSKDTEYLDRARLIDNYHWSSRNRETDLTPDAPSTGRYDSTHTFTSEVGPFALLLLRSYEITKDRQFLDHALAYQKAYDRFGWDPQEKSFWAMLTLDGRPEREDPASLEAAKRQNGYDQWQPRGHVDVWRTTMFSYEFPVEAALAAIYAWELDKRPESLVYAERWATAIAAQMPPHAGRRYKTEMESALGAEIANSGTYAENYAKAISFFLHLARATGNRAYLATAEQLVKISLERLVVNGWLVGYPGKKYYESIDGDGLLFCALLEYVRFPAASDMNF